MVHRQELHVIFVDEVAKETMEGFVKAKFLRHEQTVSQKHRARAFVVGEYIQTGLLPDQTYSLLESKLTSCHLDLRLNVVHRLPDNCLRKPSHQARYEVFKVKDSVRSLPVLDVLYHY